MQLKVYALKIEFLESRALCGGDSAADSFEETLEVYKEKIQNGFIEAGGKYALCKGIEIGMRSAEFTVAGPLCPLFTLIEFTGNIGWFSSGALDVAAVYIANYSAESIKTAENIKSFFHAAVGIKRLLS